MNSYKDVYLKLETLLKYKINIKFFDKIYIFNRIQYLINNYFFNHL